MRTRRGGASDTGTPRRGADTRRREPETAAYLARLRVRAEPGWWNRHTRVPQKHLPERACGFESRSRHASACRERFAAPWPVGAGSYASPGGRAPWNPTFRSRHLWARRGRPAHGPSRHLLARGAEPPTVRPSPLAAGPPAPGADVPCQSRPSPAKPLGGLRGLRPMPGVQGAAPHAGVERGGAPGNPVRGRPPDETPYRTTTRTGSGLAPWPRGPPPSSAEDRDSSRRLGRMGSVTHMTPEEFREYGRQVVDWVADYWERIESLPVGAQVKPGDVAAAAARRGAGAGGAVLGRPGRPRPGGDAGDHALAASRRSTRTSRPTRRGRRCWGTCCRRGSRVQGMLWATSPAVTEVETVVMDWLAKLLGAAGAVPRAPASSRTRRPARCSAPWWPRCTGSPAGRCVPTGSATGTRCTSPPRRTPPARRRSGSPGSATPRSGCSTSTRPRCR